MCDICVWLNAAAATAAAVVVVVPEGPKFK